MSKDNVFQIQRATLLQALSDPVVAIDRNEKILFLNPSFSNLYDHGKIEEMSLSSLFLDNQVLNSFRSALNGKRSDSVKATPFDLDGSRRFYSLSVSPLLGSSKEIYGALGIFHDVTDLKRAEQIRIDFVANVSHELRTPLTSIKGYTDTLMLDLQLQRKMEPSFVEAISRNVERLMNLIQDLLDLSALEESQELPHRTEFSTQELTLRTIQQLEGNLKKKKQTVSSHIEVKTAYGDPGRVEQVLVNLLDNAHKYTPEGGAIQIKWEMAQDDKNFTLLKVIDTGPGIDPEHHSRLFERFYRADKARSREMGGTGLGLAIVKHILQRHGGQVWVESILGKGATFICRFPNH